MIRAVMRYKRVSRDLLRAIHPSGVQVQCFGGTPIPEHVLRSIPGLMFVHVVSIFTLTLVMIATQLDALTVFSAVSVCLNSTEPGLNLFGSSTTCAVLNDFQTRICA